MMAMSGGERVRKGVGRGLGGGIRREGDRRGGAAGGGGG